MKPPMTRPLLELLLLTALLQSFVSAGWSEETDWESGAWAQGQRFPGARGPEFLPGLATNVSVTLGDPAVLPCRIANLRGRSVSWIRQTDLQVLTTNSITFTTDQRFSVEGLVRGPSAVWDLWISDTVQSDQGIYQCQVNTRPKMSLPVMLHVVEGTAVIAGPSSVYLHAGSRLLLTCWVHAPPRPPPLHWGHNGSLLNDTTARGGLSLFISQEGPRASTRLSLQRVDASDAGNYTCYPEGLPAASVTVYVLHEEEPAAMHHDAGHSLAYSSLPAVLVFSLPLAGIQFFSSSFLPPGNNVYLPTVGTNYLDTSYGLPVLINIVTILMSAMKTLEGIFRSERHSFTSKFLLNRFREISIHYLNVIFGCVNFHFCLPRRMIKVQYFWNAPIASILFLKTIFSGMGHKASKKFVEISVSNTTEVFCTLLVTSPQIFLYQIRYESGKRIDQLYRRISSLGKWQRCYTNLYFMLLKLNRFYDGKKGKGLVKKDRSRHETQTRMTPCCFRDSSVFSLCHSRSPLVRHGIPAIVGSAICSATCFLLYEIIRPT